MQITSNTTGFETERFMRRDFSVEAHPRSSTRTPKAPLEVQKSVDIPRLPDDPPTVREMVAQLNPEFERLPFGPMPSFRHSARFAVPASEGVK